MKKMLQDIVKGAVAFFAVGILLALAAPPLAQLLGPALLGEEALKHAVSTPVLWTGVFFGAFGALVPPIEKAYSFIFGDSDKSESAVEVLCPQHCKDKPINIHIEQTPQQVQGQALIDAKFRQNIEGERLVAMLTNDHTPSM